MSFVPVPGFDYFPDLFYAFGMEIGGASFDLPLDASGEKMAFIVRCPKAGTLDKFEFLLGAVTTFQSLKLSFQDIDLTSGLPDEVVDQFRVISASPGANSWAVPGLITSDGTDTGTKRTVSAGDLLACLIEFDLTVGDLAVSLMRGPGASASTLIQGGTPYLTAKDPTWRKLDENAALPIVALKYDDGTYVPLGYWCVPAKAWYEEQINSGSTPDEVGNLIRLPFPAKCIGGYFGRQDMGNSQAGDVVLYDSDGSSVLGSGSHDEDVQSSGVGFILKWWDEVTLKANTDYRLVYKPTNTVNEKIFGWNFETSDLMNTVSGGSDVHYTSRVDAGAWSQVTTRRILSGLILSELPSGRAARAGYLLGV